MLEQHRAPVLITGGVKRYPTPVHDVSATRSSTSEDEFSASSESDDEADASPATETKAPKPTVATREMLEGHSKIVAIDVTSKAHPDNTTNTFAFVEYITHTEAISAASVQEVVGTQRLRIEPKEYTARHVLRDLFAHCIDFRYFDSDTIERSSDPFSSPPSATGWE